VKHYPLKHPVRHPHIELGFFGAVTDMTASTVPQLPSTASVQAALNGEKHGWGKVAASTALRALLIMPGVALSGARGKDLVMGSLLGSATITAFIFFFYTTKSSNGG
jgi:hypothetical protein